MQSQQILNQFHTLQPNYTSEKSMFIINIFFVTNRYTIHIFFSYNLLIACKFTILFCYLAETSFSLRF